MNKKGIIPILVLIVLALVAAVILYAPSLWEMLLQMHGMR